jgi:hypothetical protein
MSVFNRQDHPEYSGDSHAGRRISNLPANTKICQCHAVGIFAVAC